MNTIVKLCAVFLWSGNSLLAADLVTNGVFSSSGAWETTAHTKYLASDTAGTWLRNSQWVRTAGNAAALQNAVWYDATLYQIIPDGGASTGAYTFKFQYWHQFGDGNKLSYYVAGLSAKCDNGLGIATNALTVIGGTQLARNDDLSWGSGWKDSGSISVDLGASGYQYIYIAFRASVKNVRDLYLDNVCLLPNVTLTVESAYGGAWPGTVTTNSGATLTEWVTNSPLSGGVGTQYVCHGWTMIGNEPASGLGTNVTLTLTNDATLTWNWQTNLWAPTNIVLSTATVPENQPSNTTVGAFSTQDPDTGDTFTYALVAGAGDTNNSSFAINGTNLQTAASFNYEAKSSYSVRVRTTDQGVLSYEKPFTITVLDIPEPAPVIGVEMTANGGAVLQWSSIANHTYTIHHSTNLTFGFTPLIGNIPATPPINTHTDSVQNVSAKFWRVSTEE